ncbi:hypothetical protein K1T71_002113 [Dendrolimus kikuchii]|uniref:Uncharacterized protein n=1 Tax=Dendrolimus kikuchii TaxID=765133 RepID=A0ACC1DFK7_9NEOP|nr:hypothetical protein K1T71_002113 [Dendrolimus kikuchii]
MGRVSNSRRIRTPNWSHDEKQHLLELIKQRKDVVITKNNNGPNHSEGKDVAWNEILRELAVKFGTKFNESSTKKVKTQWQNMKRIAREEIALNGTAFQKYSKQSLEVCDLLELMKDGELKNATEALNETTITANIEIKAERIDEEINQPSCSAMNNTSITTGNISNENTSQKDSTLSELNFEVMDETEENVCESEILATKNHVSVTTMTDMPFNNEYHLNTHFKEIQDLFKFHAAEKQLKMESLKDERQVMRAMRETAELNKIVAEQRLKHVLWVKQRDMAMYSNLNVPGGELGSGAGKGGGGGGSIREAGGSFGKMEAAREEEYFYKKQKEQLQGLKSHLDKEIAFHQEQIKRHEDAIRRHKEQTAELEKK